MAQAFVPDWDPTKKQKKKEAAPWETNSTPTPTSTSRSQFIPHPYVRRQPILPDSGFDWSALRSSSTVFRSTAQDAYPTPFAFAQVPNQKPKRDWQTTPWMQPLSTTSRAAFVEYGSYKRREPILPSPERPLVPTPFNTRSTASDAYKPAPSNYRPRLPIIPSNKSSPFVSDQPGMFSTTQAASYVPHMVKPYKAAPKPKSTYGGVGNH